MGPSSTLGDEGVAVMFPGNTANSGCFLTQLSRAPPPPLPGGYAVGETVYYTGKSKTLTSGDNKLTNGQAGEVTGHPDSDHATFGKGVAVKFPGNKADVFCYITSISYSKP